MSVRKVDYALAIAAIVLGVSLLFGLRDEPRNAQGNSPAVDLYEALDSLRDENALLRGVVQHSSLDSSAVLAGTVSGSRDTVELGTATAPVIMFGVDASCAACVASIPAMNELAERLPCGELMGVQMGGYEPADSARYAVGFPVYKGVSADFWRLFPMRAVPWVLLVKPRRVLGGSWRGMISPAVATSILDSVRAYC